MMKISDFQKYLDLYGADLSRWPAHEIRPAVDLLQCDPQVGKILSVAENLDRMLLYYQPLPVNINVLEDRIMRQTKGASAHKKPDSSLSAAYLCVPGGGLLIVTILGFMMGFHPAVKESFLLDPLFYTQDQLINDSEGVS